MKDHFSKSIISLARLSYCLAALVKMFTAGQVDVFLISFVLQMGSMYLAEHKQTGSSLQLEENLSSYDHLNKTLLKTQTGMSPALRLELKRPSEVLSNFS